MNQTASWLSRMFVRELEAFERELALFPDESLVWKTVPGVTNSVGTLTLHVCGNLQHFVGQGIGRTGYLRDRNHEFSARDIARDALQRELRTTIGIVERIMPQVTDDDLMREYPEAVGGVHMLTGMFLTHLSAHLAFHLGQAGYLRRALTGETRSANPVPLQPLSI